MRERDPHAASLLDSLEADHRSIEPAAEAAKAAGRRYANTDEDQARCDLLAAIDQLTDVLLPHLEREVEQAMPVVAAAMTRAEWDAIEQEFHIRPKSPRALALEGLWLIEGADRETYRLVVGGVSPVTRVVLKHGFGWLYRRRARARWTPDLST